jgi:hypothetical protein
MVKESCKTIYCCPYCNEEYDDESEAEDCARDCVDIDPVEEKEINSFECEYCHKVYLEDDKAFDEALQCEQKHVTKEDIYFCNDKRKLIEAGNNIYQDKLIGDPEWQKQ